MKRREWKEGGKRVGITDTEVLAAYVEGVILDF